MSRKLNIHMFDGMTDGRTTLSVGLREGSPDCSPVDKAALGAGVGGSYLRTHGYAS